MDTIGTRRIRFSGQDGYDDPDVIYFSHLTEDQDVALSKLRDARIDTTVAYGIDEFRAAFAEFTFQVAIIDPADNAQRPVLSELVNFASRRVQRVIFIAPEQRRTVHIKLSSTVRVLRREQIELFLVDEVLIDNPRGAVIPQRQSVAFDFDFPETISTACEQYLLYFRNFLAEIGISATTGITHDAGHALFTITPNDPAEALEHIRDALNVYLKLPETNLATDADTPEERLMARELSAAVKGLQYKLELGQMKVEMLESQKRSDGKAIEAQETTISALRAAIYVISQGNNVLTNSMQEPKALEGPSIATIDPGAKENILGGFLSVGAIEVKKGLDINAGWLIRTLRERFAKKNADNDGRGNTDWPMPMP